MYAAWRSTRLAAPRKTLQHEYNIYNEQLLVE
jgi:hypothetical protein